MADTATVESSVVKKTGQGKRGPWTLYVAKLNDGREAGGFDNVQPGDVVEIETVQNGDYTNYNFKKLKDQPAGGGQTAAPAQSNDQPAAGGRDPRVVKILVLIAEQVGVDREKVMAILEEN